MIRWFNGFRVWKFMGLGMNVQRFDGCRFGALRGLEVY